MRWFRRRKREPTPAQRAIEEAERANERTDQFKRERADPALRELEQNLEENGFSRMLAEVYRPRPPRRPSPGGAR